MTLEADRTVAGAICVVRARGEASLVEAVDFIRRHIDLCRCERQAKLLVDVAGVTPSSMPTIVDRFLAAEDWAHAANGEVIVAIVIDAAYQHPQKFGVKVAGHFGLVTESFTRESEARAWLDGFA